MYLGFRGDSFSETTSVGLPGMHTEHDGGILSGTLVATPNGWRPAEALAVGDSLLTFDGGEQVIKSLARALLWVPIHDCPEGLWPIEVPTGLLGNRRPLRLLPDADVLVESDLAEELTGDPFCLIPATALLACDGVRRVRPTGYVEVLSVQFEGDQVIYAEGGALIHAQRMQTSDMLVADADVIPSYMGLGGEVAELVAQDSVQMHPRPDAA